MHSHNAYFVVSPIIGEGVRIPARHEPRARIDVHDSVGDNLAIKRVQPGPSLGVTFLAIDGLSVPPCVMRRGRLAMQCRVTGSVSIGAAVFLSLKDAPAPETRSRRISGVRRRMVGWLPQLDTVPLWVGHPSEGAEFAGLDVWVDLAAGVP